MAVSNSRMEAIDRGLTPYILGLCFSKQTGVIFRESQDTRGKHPVLRSRNGGIVVNCSECVHQERGLGAQGLNLVNLYSLEYSDLVLIPKLNFENSLPRRSVGCLIPVFARIDWTKIMHRTLRKGGRGRDSHKRNSRKCIVNMGCTRIHETSALNPGGFHVIANLVRERECAEGHLRREGR